MDLNVSDIVYTFFAVLLVISFLISLYSYKSYSYAKKDMDLKKMKIAFRELWAALPVFFYSMLILALNSRVLSIKISIISGDFLSLIFLLALLVPFPLIPYYIKFNF